MSHATASTVGTVVRRFLLGHGPLKRTSDRLHALSRVFVLASVVAAVSVAVVIGTALSASLHATAARQAAERHPQVATLLANAHSVDPATANGPADGQVLAPAVWAAPDGHVRTGRVPAPAGASAGSRVHIWVDRDGSVTARPLPSSDITVEVGVAAGMTALAMVSAATVLHLLAVSLIDSSRDRRWAAEWASIEPLWAGRID
jgi:hypothetical protein